MGNCCLGCCPSPPHPNSQSAPQPSLDSTSQPPPDPNSQVQIVDYKQQFGNIKDATQLDPLIHHIDQPLSTINKKQSGHSPKPESEALQKSNSVSKLPEEMEKVGCRALEEVMGLPDMRGEGQRRAVIVHGFGGIGKTTLANCAMSELDFSRFRHSKIELDEKRWDARSYQQKLCKCPTGDTPHSEDSSEGREKVLGRESTFIYDENALSKTRLQELSPSDLCLPSESRMLVSTNTSPDQIDAVAVARRGVPLLLQVYARYLAHHGDPEACREVLAAPSQGDISYTDELLAVDGALVNIDSDDNVVVHDVPRALGIKLREESRVRRDDDWQKALAEKKEFKGMWLLDGKEGIDVLDMECQRLSAVRVLAVGRWIRLTGECRVSLPKLRFLGIRFSKGWMLANTQLWNMTEEIHKNWCHNLKELPRECGTCYH